MPRFNADVERESTMHCKAEGGCECTAAVCACTPVVRRPTVSVGGTFSLINHFGDRVSERSFSDRLLLIYFGFTNCRTVCPPALSRIDRVLDRLGQEAMHVQPLHITVDPDRDSPSVMREFLEERHPRILGLTGTGSEIEQVMHAFHAFAARRDVDAEGDDYLMPHSAFTYLMNQDGDYLTHFTDAIGIEEMAETVSKAVVAAELSTSCCLEEMK